MFLAILLPCGEARAQGKDDTEGIARVLKMLDGVNFFGDFRVRYEGIFDDTAIGNNRGRFRIRAGFKKTFGDIASVSFRGASGSTTEPTSTNQTFTGNFGPKTFHIDRAFGTLRPAAGVELSGGKMPAPFVKSDLIWDDDLNPEGMAESLRHDYGRGELFLHLGQFVFNSAAAAEDAYLLGFQAGMTHQISEHSRLTVAPGYVHVIRPNASLAVGLNGNLTNAAGTALLSDFRTWNALTRFETALRTGVPFQIEVDYAHNSGAAALAGKTYDDGFLVQLGLGQAKSKGDWMAKYRIARIDPDAILSAFNDSDFSFTDSRGHKLEFNYMPWDFLKLSATGYFLKSVRAGARPDRTRIQTDATLAF